MYTHIHILLLLPQQVIIFKRLKNKVLFKVNYTCELVQDYKHALGL